MKMLCMSKESRVSRVSSIQYKRGPEQAIKLHLCELEYWAICFSGSRLSHQCQHHTFPGVTCHWAHFSCQETGAICFDCGLQNSTDKTNLPQSIRSLEINQTFYVLTFQETFSSDAIFRRGRKIGEETKRRRKRTIQKASETYVRYQQRNLHKVNPDAFC